MEKSVKSKQTIGIDLLNNNLTGLFYFKNSFSIVKVHILHIADVLEKHLHFLWGRVILYHQFLNLSLYNIENKYFYQAYLNDIYFLIPVAHLGTFHLCCLTST